MGRKHRIIGKGKGRHVVPLNMTGRIPGAILGSQREEECGEGCPLPTGVGSRERAPLLIIFNENDVFLCILIRFYAL